MKTLLLYFDGTAAILHFADYLAFHGKDVFASRIAKMSVAESLVWIAKMRTILEVN